MFELSETELQDLNANGTKSQDNLKPTTVSLASSSSYSLKLTTFMVNMFLFGEALFMLASVPQVVLIAIGNNVYTTLPFVLLNTFSGCWAIFSIFFVICWGTSFWQIRTLMILITICASFFTSWIFFYYGIISGVVVSILAIFFVVICFVNAFRMFTLLTRQPYNASFATWISLFRMWAIVAAPIVATYVRDGSGTAVSFLTLCIFTFAGGFFCTHVRFDFSKYPGTKTLDQVLYRLSFRRFLSVYIPFIIMIIVFACLFVAVTAGLDRSGADLSAFFVVMGSVFVVATVWTVVLGPMGDLAPRSSWTHKIFSSITSEQYDLLLTNSLDRASSTVLQSPSVV